jgi:Glyoxalase-like domain
MIAGMIDHLVYASDDLSTASAAVADALGVEPTPGGRHIGHGTHNALLGLGGATYLEVIGPDPQQPAPDGPRPFGIDGLARPALVAWCVRPVRPLTEIIDEARTAGIELGDVTAMSRRRPDGELLEWTLTFPQLAGPFGMALPFMIDWAESSHPTDTLAASVHLLGLEVTHPDIRSLRNAFEIIGITTGVEALEGPQPALLATIATRAGEVTLSS